MRTMEQRKEIEELVAQVDELENVRKKQAHKIKHLKDEVELTSQQTQEKRLVSDNAVQALSSELRTSKNALNAIQNREKQVLSLPHYHVSVINSQSSESKKIIKNCFIFLLANFTTGMHVRDEINIVLTTSSC